MMARTPNKMPASSQSNTLKQCFPSHEWREPHVWILGSGITSLATAVYLIQDADIEPAHIHVLESLGTAAAKSVSTGDAVNGYDYRAGWVPAFNSVCVERLLSRIPSTECAGKTVLDDIIQFNREEAVEAVAHTRLLCRKSKAIRRIGPAKITLTLRDRIHLFLLMRKTEEALGRSRICEYFGKSFFRTEYWFMMANAFGFQPWHSAAEFRRCSHHFQNVADLNIPTKLERCRFNRYEAIISPITEYLESRGVDFQFNTTITDIVTQTDRSGRRVSAIRAAKKNETEVQVDLDRNDIVVVSLGSVTSGAISGSNTCPPSPELIAIQEQLDEGWLLWLELSDKDHSYGNAYNFCTRVQESRLQRFTVTLKSTIFFDHFIELTGDQPGSTTFVSLKDSNWLLTLSLPQQPLFSNQPEDVQVFFGYGLRPDRKGNYIQKPMLDCSGQEIMEEILNQLQFPVQEILERSITIPTILPRKTAPLLTRTGEHRPAVCPPGSTNLALTGRFVNIPGETTVTFDYEVRSAQLAAEKMTQRLKLAAAASGIQQRHTGPAHEVNL